MIHKKLKKLEKCYDKHTKDHLLTSKQTHKPEFMDENNLLCRNIYFSAVNAPFNGK